MRAWLTTRPVESVAAFLLSWDVETAVSTDWQTFVTHWDDFCYPGSDDLTVWSPEASWYLCYDHEEVFRFGRPDRITGFQVSYPFAPWVDLSLWVVNRWENEATGEGDSEDEAIAAALDALPAPDAAEAGKP